MFCKQVYDYSEPKELVLPQLAKDGSNKGDFFATETMVSKKFAQNYGGYPRSDIALINEQNNISVARAMVEQLTDYSSVGSENQGKSDAEIMLSVQSKYMQAPAEFLPYLENEISKRDARLAASAQSQSVESPKVDVNEVIDNA